MFKKLLAALFFSALPLSLFAQNSPNYVILNTAITNLAASTTNTGLGQITILPTQPEACRLYLKAEGNLGTTNSGGAANSNLVVYVSTASGSMNVTNSFDTAQLSNIKLTLPSLQTSTNVVSDFFELRGVRFLRVGAIQNHYAGSVSNVQVILSYPTK